MLYRLVFLQQSDSAEFQQADALSELFLELKTTVGDYEAPAAGVGDDDDDDEDDSRMSSVTDDTASRDDGQPTADIEVTPLTESQNFTNFTSFSRFLFFLHILKCQRILQIKYRLSK